MRLGRATLPGRFISREDITGLVQLKYVLAGSAAVLALAIGLITLRQPTAKPAATPPAREAELKTAATPAARRRAASLVAMPKILVSSPPTPFDQRRREVVMKYLNEQDPEKRRYIVPELVDLHDPQSVFQVLELLKTERDPQVRDNLINFLGYMPYSTNYAEEIIAAAREIHAHPVDPADRLAVQRMAIELQHPASAEFLKEVFAAADTLPEERVNAGEGLIRLYREVGLGTPAECANILEQMKLDAQAMSDPVERAQAYRAINVTRYDARDFFKRQLAMETDTDCRNVLSAYAGADVQPAPTRGPMKTPWPSPTPWVAQATVTPETAAGTPGAPYVEPTPQVTDEPLGTPAQKP
jgi:hypothetical protein